MVDIPELQQTTGLEYTSPVQAQSVENAGLIGQGLQRTGNALIGLAGDMYAVQNMKKAAKKTMDVQEAHQLYRQAGIQADDFARRVGNRDGSDYLEIYNKKLDELSQPIHDKFKTADPLTAQGIRATFMDVKNDFAGPLAQEARKNATVDLIDRTHEASNRMSATVYADPGQFDKEVDGWNVTMDSLESNKLYNAQDAHAVRNDGIKQSASSAIQGMLHRNQFKLADAMLTEKFSKYFSSEERNAIRLAIQQESRSFDSQIEIQKNRRKKELEDQFGEKMDQNFSNLGTLLLSAKNEDERNLFLSQGQAMVMKNEMRSTDYNVLKSMDNDFTAQRDDLELYRILNRSTGGEEIATIRKDVQAMVTSGGMGTKAGFRALKILEEESNHRRANPLWSKSWEAVHGKLDYLYGKENPFLPDMYPAESRLYRSRALDEVYAILSKNKDMMPSQAMEIVLKKNKGNKIPVQIPGGISTSSQQDPAEIDKAVQGWFNEMKSGKLSKQEYQKRLKKAFQQKEYLKSQEQP